MPEATCHALSVPPAYLQPRTTAPAAALQAPRRSALTPVRIWAAACPLRGWKPSSPPAGRRLELHQPSPSASVCNAKGNTTLGGRGVPWPEREKGWCIFHIKDSGFKRRRGDQHASSRGGSGEQHLALLKPAS